MVSPDGRGRLDDDDEEEDRIHNHEEEEEEKTKEENATPAPKEMETQLLKESRAQPTNTTEQQGNRQTSNGQLLSEYELERLERMRRNEEYMRKLGIVPMASAAQPSAFISSAKPPDAQKRWRTSQRRAAASRESAEPVRKSRRVANLKADTAIYAEFAEEDEQAQVQQQQEEPAYVDACTVMRYLADAPPAAQAEASSSAAAGHGKAIAGYTTHGARSYELAKGCKSYSVDAHGALVTAAGHGGFVHVFATDKEQPLLYYKAHTGWVSEVRLLADSKSLLTSSNDGAVSLWSLESVRADDSLTPERKMTSKVHGGSGIFSMDIYEQNCAATATAAKDGSIMVSSFASSDYNVTWQRNDAHAGVAKSVRWRDANVMGSAGNDGSVRLWDVRMPESNDACADFAGMPDGGVVNFAEFGGEHYCACSGFSREVAIWDTRRLDQHVCTLVGHCGGTGVGQRIKSLYRAVYTPDAKHVVVCGPGSASLSLYDGMTGACLSRGELGSDATAIKCTGSRIWLAFPGRILSASAIFNTPTSQSPCV